MTTANDPLSPRVAALRLDGERFKAKGIPVSALPEVLAFDELLRDIAKQIWKKRHPNRKRVPRGYDETIELRLVEIRGGSTTSVLERPRGDADDLFDEQEILSDLSAARVELERFIDAASTNEEVPELVSNVDGYKLKKFGQSLRPNDVLQVGPDDANWEERRTYTSESRQRVLIKLIGSYTGAASVQGVVDTVNLPQRTCVIRAESGALITASWADTGTRFEFDDNAQSGLRCSVDGIGEYNRDGLARFVQVDSFQLLDGEDDGAEDIASTNELEARHALRSLSSLGSGWLDGDAGEPVAELALATSNRILNLLVDSNLLTPLIFATTDGGVQFEWRRTPNSVSLEVESTGEIYLHRANLANNTYEEKQFGPLEVADVRSVEAIGELYLPDVFSTRIAQPAHSPCRPPSH